MIKLSQAHILGTIIAYLLGIFIVPLVIFKTPLAFELFKLPLNSESLIVVVLDEYL